MTPFLHTPIFEFQLFEIIVVIFCGLVFGSFASAITYRVPLGLPWATKGKSEHGLRSACPSCKTKLKARDLIPIFSWLSSKGKCRHCNTPISKTYPVCEALTLLGCIGIYCVYGLTPFAIPFYLMIPFLIALMMIDLKYMILPNQLVAIIFTLGFIAVFLRMMSIESSQTTSLFVIYFGGAIAYGLFSWGLGALMEKILKKEALGFGDVKFFTAAGIWLGLPAIGQFCIGAGAIGVVLSIIWKKYTGQAVFPFGPALILSFYAVLLLQGSHFL